MRDEISSDPSNKIFTVNQMNMSTVRYYEGFLQELFQEYWPQKINQIPVLLAKYRGRERFLVTNLQRKALAIRMKGVGRKVRIGAKAYSAIDTLQSAAQKGKKPTKTVNWDQLLLIALATNKPQKIRQALRMHGANVNETVTWRDGVNWGWTDQVFFGEAGGTEFGLGLVKRFRYVEGDTLVMMALKTQTPELVRAVMQFSPDLTPVNAWNQSARDIAKINCLAHVLNETPIPLDEDENAAPPAAALVKMGGWM